MCIEGSAPYYRDGSQNLNPPTSYHHPRYGKYSVVLEDADLQRN